MRASNVQHLDGIISFFSAIYIFVTSLEPPMRLHHIFLTLIFLAAVASAEPDYVIMGPYNVSFDLGVPRAAYQVVVDEPVEKEGPGGAISTQFSAYLENRTGIHDVVIGLFHNEKSTPPHSVEEIEMTIFAVILNSGNTKNIQTEARMIDGTEGGIGTAVVDYGAFAEDKFMATYHPLIDPEHLTCIITSTYPWEGGTVQLLRSIHVGTSMIQ